MPHFTVEYSANIEKDMALKQLLETVHAAAVKAAIFPLGGIRVRAVKRDHYIVADGDPANGFVHVTARIRQGRTLEDRKRVGEMIMEAVCAHLESLYDKRPLAISFEMQEIDPDVSFKKNNIHDYLKLKEGGRHE